MPHLYSKEVTETAREWESEQEIKRHGVHVYVNGVWMTTNGKICYIDVVNREIAEPNDFTSDSYKSNNHIFPRVIRTHTFYLYLIVSRFVPFARNYYITDCCLIAHSFAFGSMYFSTRSVRSLVCQHARSPAVSLVHLLVRLFARVTSSNS